jgi:hypothetical protein
MLKLAGGTHFLVLFTYDHLPDILAHRERMAEIKKDKNNE